MRFFGFALEAKALYVDLEVPLSNVHTSLFQLATTVTRAELNERLNKRQPIILLTSTMSSHYGTPPRSPRNEGAAVDVRMRLMSILTLTPPRLDRSTSAGGARQDTEIVFVGDSITMSFTTKKV